MFFGKDITAIFITRGKIQTAVFSPTGKIKKETKDYEWTKDSLPEVIKKIAARGPARTRIVFGEEFSYVTAVPLQKKEKKEIFRQAQEKIPEKLKANWDFAKGNSAKAELQLAAIQPEILDIFQKNFSAAGLKIESIEPQSVAIARLFPEKGAFVFIVSDEKIVLGIVDNQTIEASCVSSKNEIIEDLGKFIEYARKKLGHDPKKIFVGSGINPESEIFKENNILAEVLDLNPLRGAALKKDISGNDCQVLNIKSEKTDLENDEEKMINCQMSLREKMLIFSFILIVTLAIIFILIKRF